MNNLKLSQPGGAWAYQNTLKFMQDTYTPLLATITAALGDNVIISGCVQVAGNMSAGWIILNGEILPYEGGVFAQNFDVQELVSQEQYDDGTQKDFYIVRKAVMTISGGVPFANFSQIKTLAAFRSLPTVPSSDYSESSEDKLATIKAVFDLKTELNNILKQFNSIIVQWSGSISEIPSGWFLCDGQNGTPDLRDKFIVGAGSLYGTGQTGGEATHTLTVDEMPNHSHPYSKTINGGSMGDNASGLGQTTTDTGEVGGGLPHNNLPPYYALAYIQRIPII